MRSRKEIRFAMTTELMLAAARSFLFVLVTMLPILNPAATAPIFLSMTDGASPATRTLLARRIARNMFWLMTGSMLVGSYVLDFFGISLPIVRVGGGLILASVAWRLLGATPVHAPPAEIQASLRSRYAEIVHG